MTLKYRTKGLVFKKEESAEADRIFSVFTKDFGRLDLKAKAIRKMASKLRADMDIFFLSEIEFIQGKNNKTLTDAVKIRRNNNISKNQDIFKTACQISEILNNFIKGQEKDEVSFNLVQEIFDKLENDNIKNCQLAFQYFIWNFLSLQGYHLQMQVCVACLGKLNSEVIYFSSQDGGAVCDKCFNAGKTAQKINADVIKILRLILDKNWKIVAKLKVDDASLKLMESISENAAKSFCPEHC